MKNKIFALYLGSQVLDDQQVTRELRAVHNHGFCTLSYNGIGEQENIEIDDLQLILTPLSEITDEDAIEAYKLEFPKWDEPLSAHEEEIGASKLNREEIIDVMRNEILPDGEMSFRTADFLRSRSYHLPYMGLDLYQQSIAVKPAQ